MSIGSKLTLAKQAVTSKVGRQILLTQKHSPAILFTVGTVGVVTSTVMACKATLQLETTLEKHRAQLLEIEDFAIAAIPNPDVEYTDKDLRKDRAIVRVRQATSVGRLYAPAATVGLLSVCALGGSHVILTKRNTAVMAAYATIEKAFAEYQERVVAVVGPEKEREIRYALEDREIAVDDPETGRTEVEVVKTPTAEALGEYRKMFGRDTSQSWSPVPEYNLIFLRGVQNQLNDQLYGKGHVFLNDAFDALGLDRTKVGSQVGWVKNNANGDNIIDFGIFSGEDPLTFHDFMTGRENSILLDFNVDGVIWNLI